MSSRRPGRYLVHIIVQRHRINNQQTNPPRDRASALAIVVGGVARSLCNDRALGALCSRLLRSIRAPIALENCSRLERRAVLLQKLTTIRR